jgi:hypothetical protein
MIKNFSDYVKENFIDELGNSLIGGSTPVPRQSIETRDELEAYEFLDARFIQGDDYYPRDMVEDETYYDEVFFDMVKALRDEFNYTDELFANDIVERYLNDRLPDLE